MNIVRILIKKLKEAEPNLNWVAFFLKGGGDSFGGFEAVEAEISNQIIKKDKITNSFFKLSESDAKNYKCAFEEYDKIINKFEVQDELLNTILPEGVYFKSVDQGACDGILLFKCRSDSNERHVKIDLGKYGYFYDFQVKKNFEGCVLKFENAEDNLGKDYPNDALPFVFPGIYLEEIKNKIPEINWGAVGIKYSEKGVESYELNQKSLSYATNLKFERLKKSEVENVFLSFKNEIIKDLLLQEGLIFPKDKVFKIYGVIYFINKTISEESFLQNVDDMAPSENFPSTCEFQFKINEGFSGISFRYRLFETFTKEVVISKLQIEEIANIKYGCAYLESNCELTEEVARILAAFDGPLYLPINSEISNVFAQTIIKHNGKGIYFVEETSCDEESEGPKLSNQTAEILSRYKGNLSFDFLPKLNYGDTGDVLSIAKAFGEHKGGSLSLLNLKELSAEAAILLCKHEEPVEMDTISDAEILKIFEEAQRRWTR